MESGGENFCTKVVLHRKSQPFTGKEPKKISGILFKELEMKQFFDQG